MKRILALALILIVAGPGALSAQDHDSDRLGTRIDWGTAMVLLLPSPKLGLQFTISTTAYAQVEPMRGFGGGFQPDSALEWINTAALIAHPTAAPHHPDAVLITPALHAASGDSLRMMRRAKGDHWEKRVALLLDASGSGHRSLDILVEPRKADALLQGILREASLSGYDADSVTVALAELRQLPRDVDTPPRLLSTGRLLYPDHSKRGRVTVQFIVDTSGRPDMTSFRAIAADHMIFADWVRAFIVNSRFEPGRANGHPVPVLVMQNVNYEP